MTTRALAVLLCALALGCGESTEDGEPVGITVTGVVKEFETDVERQKFEPVAGVEVCVYQNEDIDCDVTTSQGTFELVGIPTDANVMLSFEKKDYAPALRMLATRQEDYDILAETALAKLSLGVDQAKENGIPLESIQGGAIQFFAAEPGDGVLQVALLEGYDATLRNTDGTAAKCWDTDGILAPCRPLYLDENGKSDQQLIAASRTGVGAFGNVPPGKYKLFISHPDLDCKDHLPEAGWHAEEEDAVVVKVVDEWVTAQVGVFCQPPE